MTHPFYVNPNGDLHIEAIVRAQAVKRWHMIDTTRMQSVAEHSANVAMLMYYISHHAPQAYFGSPAGAALSGLLHDISEAFTGDIPGHTKRELQGIDELESRLTPPTLTYKVSDSVGLLMKLCDLADGVRFISAHGVGTDAGWARDCLIKKLNDKKAQATAEWPQVVYNSVVAKIDNYIWGSA